MKRRTIPNTDFVIIVLTISPSLNCQLSQRFCWAYGIAIPGLDGAQHPSADNCSETKDISLLLQIS
jgi:hypothetical protein